MTGDREQQGVNGVEIGLNIAYALAALPGPSHLREIAEAAQLSPSTTHRYLVSLCRAGLLEQDATDGRYDLAAGAIKLGLAAQNRLDAFKLVDDVTRVLFDKTQLTTSVFAWGERGPTVVRRVEPLSPVVVTVRIGSPIPILTSAAGRLFAAFLPGPLTSQAIEAEVASQAGGKAAQKAVKVEFDRIITGIRQKGFAWSASDSAGSFNAVSAPVFDANGQMVMAISLISPGPKSLQASEHTTSLIEACRYFSARLGSAVR